MKMRGSSYPFGFFVEVKELGVKVYSKNCNEEKIQKYERKEQAISRVVATIILVVLPLSFYILLLQALDFILGIELAMEASSFVIFLTIILFSVVGLGVGSYFFFDFFEKIFLPKVFSFIFSYIECLISKNLRQYHAAEHKVIDLLAKNFPATLENLKGTSSFGLGCKTIENFPKFLWFLERLTLSEPPEEKLKEGLEVMVDYYNSNKNKNDDIG